MKFLTYAQVGFEFKKIFFFFFFFFFNEKRILPFSLLHLYKLAYCSSN